MSQSVASSSVFERCERALGNLSAFVEGSVWAIWLGWNVRHLNIAIKERQQVNACQNASAGKTHQIYKAQKKLFLNTAGVVSATATCIVWLDKAKVIFLTPLIAAITNSVAYHGTTLTSSVRVFEELRGLYTNFLEFSYTQDFASKKKFAFQVFRSLLKVVCYTLLVAWGVLGGIWSFAGKEALSIVLDKLLYYAILLFVGDIALEIFAPPKPI